MKSRGWLKPSLLGVALICLLGGEAIADPPKGGPAGGGGVPQQIDALRTTIASTPTVGPRSPRDLIVLSASGLSRCSTAGTSGVRLDQRINPDGTTTANFTI